MRNLFLSVFTIFAFVFTSEAQTFSDNALGLRLGDNDGFGAEVTYQRKLGDANRLEIDLGWRDANDYDAIRVVGLYQWVWHLDGDFNWYVGAGGGLASYTLETKLPGGDDSETSLFIAGDIGIEYNFEIPLMLSIDFRPEIGLGEFKDDMDFDIALGLRYQF